MTRVVMGDIDTKYMSSLNIEMRMGVTSIDMTYHVELFGGLTECNEIWNYPSAMLRVEFIIQ